jgi:hypothetical protein
MSSLKFVKKKNEFIKNKHILMIKKEKLKPYCKKTND